MTAIFWLWNLKIKGGTKKQIQEELSEAIERSSYFRNSLIYGTADGNLTVNKYGRFGAKMSEILKPEIQRFIAQEPEYDSQHLSLSTLTPVCKTPVNKPEFADFLADSIEAILKKAHLILAILHRLGRKTQLDGTGATE
jgi:hypothetical protein